MQRAGLIFAGSGNVQGGGLAGRGYLALNLDALGTIVDDQFVTESVLGTGGYGVVYQARQIRLDRTVALKMLDTSLREKDEVRQRFEREAMALGKLKHRNLVMFYGAGFWQNRPYMYMELVQGTTLQSLIEKEQRLAPERAVAIILQLLEGIACAHSNGILHRDLKPTNIMLVDRDGEEVLKIIDFGLAKLISDAQNAQPMNLTQDGMTVGTKTFMSPEQIIGRGPDHRSDIYAVGCLLHVCLTGLPPYESSNSMEVLLGHLKDTPAALSESLAPGSFAPGLQAVLNRALCKDPNERYQSADEMAADLRLLQRNPDARISQSPVVTRNSALRNRRAVLSLMVGGVIVFAIIGAVLIPISLSHKSSIDYYKDGKAKEAAGNRSKALLDYMKALELRQKDALIDDKWAADICSSVSTMLLDQKQNEQAARYASQGVRLWFRQSRAASSSLVSMTNIFLEANLRLGRPVEGALFTDTVIRRCGPSFWAEKLALGTRIALLNAYIHSGQFKKASVLLDEVVVNKNKYPTIAAELLLRKGQVELGFNKPADAMKSFEEGMSLDPRDDSLKISAAIAAIELNDWDSAARYKKLFDEHSPFQVDDSFVVNGLLAAHRKDWWTARHQLEWLTDVNMKYPMKYVTTRIGWGLLKYQEMCCAAGQRQDCDWVGARRNKLTIMFIQYSASVANEQDLRPF